MKSISEIISHAYRYNFTKSNLYELRIYGGVSPFVNDAPEKVTMNCSSVTTPGKNIGYNQNKRYGIGRTYQTGYNRSFMETTLTFYQSEDDSEYRYFSEWQDQIVNKDSQLFSFLNDYAKTMHLIQYNKKKEKMYELKLLDCWPSNISPLEKAYDNNDIPRFTVNIQFSNIEEIFRDSKNISFNFFADII